MDKMKKKLRELKDKRKLAYEESLKTGNKRGLYLLNYELDVMYEQQRNGIKIFNWTKSS